MSRDAQFTPAAGRFVPTGLYDWLLALLTREGVWRAALLDAVNPQPGERILDVGCGTGTFAIQLKQREPNAVVVGIDPDPDARRIAAAKSGSKDVTVDWLPGFARDAANHGRFDKVVSSLVFHQVPIAEKRAGLAAMFAATVPGGSIFVADYARQTGWLMRQAFRIIQLADGHADTQPNADGFLETELSQMMGMAVAASRTFSTPTGAISIFAVTRGSQD